MKEHRVARWIWEYRQEHGIPGDRNRDWYDMERFMADDFWGVAVLDARAWENKHGVSKKSRVDEKLLVWRWLDNVVYSHDGSDPIRVPSIWKRVYNFVRGR